MRVTKRLSVVCCWFYLSIAAAHPAGLHTVKGIVITPDGTVVPEFSVVIRHISDKPELVQRKHFKNGEFTIDGLKATQYQLQVSSPSYVATKLIFDFSKRAR